MTSLTFGLDVIYGRSQMKETQNTKEREKKHLIAFHQQKVDEQQHEVVLQQLSNNNNSNNNTYISDVVRMLINNFWTLKSTSNNKTKP